MNSRMLPVAKPITGPEFLACWMPVFFPQFLPTDQGYRLRCCQLLGSATGKHPLTFQKYAGNGFADLPFDVCHTLAVSDFAYRSVDWVSTFSDAVDRRFDMIYPEHLQYMQHPKKRRNNP